MSYLPVSHEVSDRISRIPSEQSKLLRMELGVLLLSPSEGDAAPNLAFAAMAAAHFAHRERSDRSIVNSQIGHRERSEATLGVR